MERRSTLQPVAVTKRADGKSTITGYAAVFYREGEAGTEYNLWDDLVERIAPGAFDRALKEKHDARGLYNHDPANLLGRVSSGTTRLTVDAKGLRYEIDLPDTRAGQDVAALIERGDLSGSSFAFMPRKVTYSVGDQLDVRTIEDVDLFDVGPVTYPAYEGTSVGMRSGDKASRADYEAWKARSREVQSVLLSLDIHDSIS